MSLKEIVEKRNAISQFDSVANTDVRSVYPELAGFLPPL